MMETAILVVGVLAWLLAGSSVLLGGHLTRSVMIGYAFVACLCLVLLIAGAGYLAVVVSILAAIGIASIQIFGWMLVDVDRDHLAPTDMPTWIARVLAVALLGSGLFVLVSVIAPELVAPATAIPIRSVSLGRMLFGPLAAAAVLMGLAIAAALLAAMLLLRDNPGEKARHDG